MSKTSRVNIKEWSKKELNSNFKFYVVLIICALLAIILSRGISSWPDVHQIDIENTSLNFIYGWFGLSFAVSVIGAMFQTSAMFTMIDITRGEEKHTAPMQKTFAIFDKGQYFLGWIVISILVGIFTFLWSLLLIFPGIIKSYAYSQSVFIYRDAIKRGKPMGYLEAITESRKRMVGKKWFLFVFDLSFLGWIILATLTAGILGLWVFPYYWISKAKFYSEFIDKTEPVNNDPVEMSETPAE